MSGGVFDHGNVYVYHFVLIRFSAININAEMFEGINQLSARITQIEETREGVNECHDNNYFSLVINGLSNCVDITESVNKLFIDMNLGHVRCVTAIRTLHIPESIRQAVVIAPMRCLKDNRGVLYRKHLLCCHPGVRNDMRCTCNPASNAYGVEQDYRYHPQQVNSTRDRSKHMSHVYTSNSDGRRHCYF